MKIVKVRRSGVTAAGVVEGELVRIIGHWHEGEADETRFPIAAIAQAAAADTDGEVVPLASVQLAVPCDPLRKIICVGMNYRDHTSEIQVDVSEFPVLFSRTIHTLVAHGEPIERPRVSETFDFEGEIAVVIGRDGRHIEVADALDHVLGYSCFLDGSVRQYQRHSLTAGKNFLRSGAMGPWIVTRDEIGEEDLLLRTRLNGTEVQSAHASQMIFGIAEVIAYVSRFTRLRAGDVIATGTPGGVGSRRVPPLWMKPGDAVEVEVSSIGRLANPVVDEA